MASAHRSTWAFSTLGKLPLDLLMACESDAGGHRQPDAASAGRPAGGAKHGRNMPGGCFTAWKHCGMAAETPPGEARPGQGALRGGSDEAHHRRDQALQAG